MVRTQVSLSAEQHRRAKKRAAELGVSLSELIRRGLEAELEPGGPERSEAGIESIFGLFDSGGSDVARYKDRYVDEAVWKLHLEKTGQGDRPSE